MNVITIFSCLFCTFVGNIDKPLSPSSEWFWSVNSIRPTWNCYEKVMRQRSWCVRTEVKHTYKSVLVEVAGGASWGLAEVSYRIREHRGFPSIFFFSFLNISPHQRSEWSIDPKGETAHDINIAPTPIHILQLSSLSLITLVCKMVHLKERYFHECD